MSRIWFLRYDHSSLQRLGALKVLVGLLDEQRRSVSSEKLDRSLVGILLEFHGGNQRGSRRVIPRFLPPQDSEAEPRKEFPRNVAEKLLADIEAPSLLFPVTEPKVFRIREWGKLMGFLGSGNQITERGLLLQHFMGPEKVMAIRKGQLDEYNPFRLSLTEKVFFLYVLLERDGIWPFLFQRIAALGDGHLIDGVEADKLTCNALLDLLGAHKMGLSGREMLRRRDLHHLVVRMAESLRMPKVPGSSVMRPPRPSRVLRPTQRGRVRTNTADDQAIPRFENLVDLGFLTKETDAERESGSREDGRVRRLAWRYVVAPPLIRWCNASAGKSSYDDEFLWRRFASCAGQAYAITDPIALSPTIEPVKVIDIVVDSYNRIHRPIGHTPFESIALTAMVRGIERNVVCEMADMHGLILGFKREGLFSEYIRFASGNELDRMFIDIDPRLLDRVRGHYEC